MDIKVGRFKGSTLVEVVVSMILLMTTIGISLTIIVTIEHKSSVLEQSKAMFIGKEALSRSLASKTIQPVTETDGLLVKTTMEQLNDNDLYHVRVMVYNADDKLVWTAQQLMIK